MTEIAGKKKKIKDAQSYRGWDLVKRDMTNLFADASSTGLEVQERER